ncbi:MAG: hypothetical protein WC315_00450 [Candidatus Omnitrophota bacterium]|jgi:hypothetical protein
MEETLTKTLEVDIQNLIMAFEALSTGKTLDDAYLLVEDLGYKDRIILVGHKGITTLSRVCTEPDWAKQPMEKVIIKFKGGPGPEICGHSIFTASVRAYVVDRLIKTVMASGVEPALEAIKVIWGINVKCGASIDDPVLSN